ncbi:MAG: 2-hydroxy-3-oxopropionate reductase [Chloroflexi bacterium]|nr:2-hydroxy-3-oxopropionate reductase [Chloroflexota bacterium]
MPERIGFIGLGIMGRPMAHNLVKAGYPLIVHNRSRAAVQELVAVGAQVAVTPREVAERSNIIITMLPDSPDVAMVVGGPNGILEGIRPKSIIIDMSTIAPGVARGLAAKTLTKGAVMLDAPVSGGDKGAIAGTLSIMVGGPYATFEQVLPVLSTMGKTIVHVGSSGAGQTVKACNQIVVALTIEAVSEALVLGSKAGVDPARILEVLGGGLAANRVMEMRGPGMLQHTFTPGFKVRLHHKDLGIALDAGKQFGVPLPVTALVDQFLAAMISAGDGELDHSALLKQLEKLAQHRVGHAAVTDPDRSLQ